jgi:hypothetical protein
VADGFNSKNFLDIASEFFDCGPDQDLYIAIRDCPVTKLWEFQEAYRVSIVSGMLQVPSLKEGELRPYVASPKGAGVISPWMRGSKSLDAKDFESEESVWAAIDAIKHRLLYCHSVALDNPFMGLLYDLDCPMEVYRTQLASFMSFLVHIRPLLEQGIVCFMPPDNPFMKLPDTDHPRTSPLAPLLADFLEEQAREGFLFPVEEIYRRAPVDVQERWTKGRWDKAEDFQLRLRWAFKDRINRAFAPLHATRKTLTPYLPFRCDLDIIATFQNRVQARAAEIQPALRAFPAWDNWLLAQLMDVDLPRIEALTPGEIVAIRSDETFENWRISIRTALQQAAALPFDLVNRDRAAKSIIKDILTPTQDSLTKKFETSRFLANLRTGTTALVCGSLGALAGYLINPGATMLVLGGAISVKAVDVTARFICDQIATEKLGGSRDSRRALMSHYSAVLD